MSIKDFGYFIFPLIKLMTKSYKIICSTLAVVMIVNSFAIVLPVVGYAQAVEKQAVQQTELTQAQKAEMEKAQKEARQAMYKELNLSTSEKLFVETYADKMDSFNQTLDKYVTYNKSNGNATLNVTNTYKDIKVISKTTGLSQSQVLTLKDIALKMVRNYNKSINSIKTETYKSKSSNSISTKDSFIEEAPVISITKTINERGITVNAETIVTKAASAKSLSGFGCDPFINYINYGWTWTGYTVTVSISNCGVEKLGAGGVTQYNVDGLVAAYLQGGLLRTVSSTLFWSRFLYYNLNVYVCNRKGITTKLKIAGPVITYSQCN